MWPASLGSQTESNAVPPKIMWSWVIRFKGIVLKTFEGTNGMGSGSIETTVSRVITQDDIKSLKAI